MNKAGVVLIGFLLLCSASLKAQKGIYFEDFKTVSPKWPTQEDANTRMKVENGKFVLTQKLAKYSYQVDEVAVEDERDYSIETLVTHISGSEQGPFGLVFASSGVDNYYMFGIMANGNYTFGYRNQGKYTAFIHPTASQFIKKGNNVANKLRIETAGDKIKLFVNDHQVNLVNKVDAYGNDIGFVVEHEQTAAFDYLKVEYLQDAEKDAVSTPVAAVTNLPKDTVKHLVATAVVPTAAPVISPPASAIVPPTVAVIVPPTTATIVLSPAIVQPPVILTPTVVATPPAVKDSIKQAVIIVVKKPVIDTVRSVKPVPDKPIVESITQMVFHSNFPTTDPAGWILNQTDSVKTSITVGSLKIVRSTKTWFTEALRSAATPVDMQREFFVETSTTHYAGSQHRDYGLEFGADSLQAYHFCINAAGDYDICYTNNNGITRRINYSASDFIIKGDSIKNTLGVEHKAGQLLFFINRHQVAALPEINFSGQQFGFSVNANQTVGFDHLTFGYLDQPPPPKKDTIPGPVITITYPQLATRGLKVVHSDTLHVTGTAKDAYGIFSVKVNEVETGFDRDGNFTTTVTLAPGDNTLRVIALNNEKSRSAYTFHVTRNGNSAVTDETTVQPLVTKGKYYALLIGEETYGDSRIPSLEGPVKDANTLKDALLNNYTFEPENIVVLPNPTREQLFNAMIDIKSKVTAEDNVLIFYAGHGYYDENTAQGYWFPSDAVKDKNYTWISNSDIATNITSIKSKHTLLIIDACFSGSIFRTRSIDFAPKAIKELYKLPSRKAMTSGTLKEEVADNSAFLKYLVQNLVNNPDPYLSSEQLFGRFKDAVINNSDALQVPQFGEIRGAGDEGGDFIFERRVKN